MRFTIENDEYKVSIEHVGSGEFNLLKVMNLVDKAMKSIGYYDSSMTAEEYKKWEDAEGF
jgi:hypothetical protein